MTIPSPPQNSLASFVTLTDGGSNLGGSLASPFVVTNQVSALASSGSVFLAGTGNLALTVAGNARLAFANPSGSGKTAFVFALSIMATASGFGELYVNPTAGVPTATRPANNVYIGNPAAAVCVVTADTNATTALSGGTDSGVAIGIAANTHETFLSDLPPLVVPAGITLGINVPFSATTSNTSVNVYWFEQ